MYIKYYYLFVWKQIELIYGKRKKCIKQLRFSAKVVAIKNVQWVNSVDQNVLPFKQFKVMVI